MPNRIIKESIKTSEQIDSLSWFEEVVYYRLLVTADDYGCMDGRAVLLKSELFPIKDTVTKKAVEDAINTLASVGLLCKYTVSGKPYLFFPTWEKHQRVRNRHRKYPAPPSADELLTIDSGLLSNDGQLTASCLLESESNPNTNPNPNPNPNSYVPPAGVTKPHSRFTPPSLEEVEDYCRERDNGIDAQHFLDYYESNGWRVGKNPMKDWRAAVRTWERRNTNAPRESSSGNTSFADIYRELKERGAE